MKKKIEFTSKSKTLSNSERDNLLNKMIADAFEKRELKIAERKKAFGDELYGEFVQPYLKHIEKLPDYLKTKSGGIEVRLKKKSGYSHSYTRSYDMTKERLFIRHNNSDSPDMPVEEYKKLHRISELIDQSAEKLEEKKGQVKAKTRGAIYACKTTKQLYESWPEAYGVYIEMYPPEQPANLPMIPRADLNKELGL